MCEVVRSEACDFLILLGHLGSSRHLNFRPLSRRFRRGVSYPSLIAKWISRARAPSFPNNCLCSMHHPFQTAFQTLSQERALRVNLLPAAGRFTSQPPAPAASELAANFFPYPCFSLHVAPFAS